MHHVSKCHKKKTSLIVISSHIERPKATFVVRPNHCVLPINASNQDTRLGA